MTTTLLMRSNGKHAKQIKITLVLHPYNELGLTNKISKKKVGIIELKQSKAKHSNE